MTTQMIDIKDLLDKLEDRETRLRAAEESYRELERKCEHLERGLKDANERIKELEAILSEVNS